jgi:hypothetical protein
MDPESIPADERDIRLDDYLADKLQTNADFANLDTLLASVEAQHAQLQAQLEKAELRLSEARKSSADHTSSILEQTQEFKRQHNDIDRRLKIVTASDAPDEAIQKFKTPLAKLRKLELAQAYVELLKDVDTLAIEARRHLPANPKEALKPYNKLKVLSGDLQKLSKNADDSAGHLVALVDKTAEEVWAQMKSIMLGEFTTVHEQSKWPSCDEEWIRKWTECFQRLLDLQAPELAMAKAPLVLLPFQVIIKPYEQEFRYHFMQKRPTNNKRKVSFDSKFLDKVTHVSIARVLLSLVHRPR